MPYYMYEFTNSDDVIDRVQTDIHVAGINYKPTEFVVLKAEYAGLYFRNSSDWRFTRLVAQMAVSF